MKKIKSVLFVCTGNSCRSVIAEALMKKYLKELGKDDIEVHSAGILAVEGMPPTGETIEVMKKADIDVGHYKSKNLTEKMVKTADIIFAMDDRHRNKIINMVPEASDKTYLLREFGNTSRSPGDIRNVPDPIGKPVTFYEYCFKIIEEQIKRIANTL
jgi:protein-tyrosine-phosphatase